MSYKLVILSPDLIKCNNRSLKHPHPENYSLPTPGHSNETDKFKLIEDGYGI